MDSNKCTCGCGYSKSECSTRRSEGDRYMFFDNLKTIKAEIDALLQMNPEDVTNILNNGHDWAADHIATSKDDIEEVANFLMNKMHESPDSEDEMFEYDESYESDKYVGEKYSCNDCGTTYKGGIYEDGEPASVCEACGGTVKRM